MLSSNATSPRSSWPTTVSSSLIACSKLISSTSLIGPVPPKPSRGPPQRRPMPQGHTRLQDLIPPCLRNGCPPHRINAQSPNQNPPLSGASPPKDHSYVHQIQPKL